MISSLKQRAKYFLSHMRGLARFGRASFGIHKRECNVCGNHGKFFSFGVPPRLDARCPSCGSLERHRLFALLLARERIVDGCDVLQFAPELGLAKYVRSRPVRSYLSADLFKFADLQLDIEDMKLADGQFDVIICSHVLEHVNDRKALKEIRRVLRSGGVALIMNPIIEGWDQTYENPAIISESDRLLHFGQEDHVRFYGRDFRERILMAGLTLTEFTAVEPDVARYGLMRGEKVFICRKSAAPHQG